MKKRPYKNGRGLAKLEFYHEGPLDELRIERKRVIITTLFSFYSERYVRSLVRIQGISICNEQN